MILRNLRSRIGTLIGVGILAVLVWRLGTGAFLDGLRRIDGPTLLAALGIGLLTTVFSAWRWCLVADGLGIRLPLGRAVADYYRSLFLNAALPGGVLGDVHRAVRHGQGAGDIGRGVRAVVLERAAGQVVLVAVGLVVLLARPDLGLAQAGRMLQHLTAMRGTALLLAVLALAAVCGLVAAAVVRFRGGPGTSRWRRAVRSALSEARLALFARRSWPGIVVSSFVVLAGHLGMFLLAARVAGATAPAVQLLPLMVLALLAMALPLNVGGWGPREGVTAWAFGIAGLGAAQGLTVAVVYGVLAFAACLPGIGVLGCQGLAGLRRSQGELEEGVLAEEGTPHRRTQRVPQHRGAGEAQARDTFADQHRGNGDVEPVQRPLVHKARHGHAAALHQHPAQAAPRECAQQPPRGERIAVRQGQDLDSVAVRNGPRASVALADHP